MENIVPTNTTNKVGHNKESENNSNGETTIDNGEIQVENSEKKLNNEESKLVNGKNNQHKIQNSLNAGKGIENMKISGPNKKKTIHDFKLSRVLGEGAYSTVIKATDISSQRKCALKILSKIHIIKQNKVHIVNREKKILTMLTSSPFFVRLFCTFQDEDSLYFVLSLAEGGELFDYIKQLQHFSIETTRFYSAEIFSAIYYLHDKNIVHRDMKPENILLSDHLHIMITDFGTSKILNDVEDEKTSHRLKRSNSFVGTAQYVSPEMLKQSYSCKSSDIWAIGVIIYQMITGKFAFNGLNEYYMFQNISNLVYTVPDFVEIPVRQLIESILILDPNDRFGCEEAGGFLSVKNHPFYENVQWNNLLDQKPPDEIKKLYKQRVRDLMSLPSEDHDDESLLIRRATTKHTDNKSLENMDSSHSSSSDDSSSKDTINEEQRNRKSISSDLNREVWSMFTHGQKIIKRGYLYKKKGLMPRKRMFIITEGPSIFYVDPEHMELKGTIPFSKELFCTSKNFVTFFIHTPKRVYVLEDRTNNSHLWIKAIEDLHKKYF